MLTSTGLPPMPTFDIAHTHETERMLEKDLQTAYDHYLAFPDKASADALNVRLTAAIEKLEKDKATAVRLAREADERVFRAYTTEHASSGKMPNFVERMTEKLKTLFTDDIATQEHYEQLVAKYDARLQELSHLRDTVQQSSQETEITEYFRHQRRLLQTGLPITTKQICYPDGVCDLRALSNGFSGVEWQGNKAGDSSGSSVSGIGDFNGDGIADAAIGAPNAGPSGRADAGETYVVFGNATWDGVSNLTSFADGQRGVVFRGGTAGELSGSAVAGVDINGDRLTDLFIGAPGSGCIYAVFGSNSTNWNGGIVDLPTLMNGQDGFKFLGTELDASSVSGVGDVNGDGIPDVAIGASNAKLGAGETHVVFGSRNSTWGGGSLNLTDVEDGVRGFRLQGKNPGDNSGFAVSGVGDVNGDGIADAAIGAPNAGPPGKSDAGETHVVFGSRNSTWGGGSLNLTDVEDGVRGFRLLGKNAGDKSGSSISKGDVNGDGIGDVIVGAPGVSAGAGETSVVFGSRNSTWNGGSVNLTDVTDGVRGVGLPGEAAIDNSGTSVSTGDFNRDGLSDVVIGAYAATFSGKSFVGKGYVVFGSNRTNWNGVNLATLNGQDGFVFYGDKTGDFAGNSVSTADVNGDGRSDVIVGAYQADSPGELNAGKVYVVFGEEFPFYFSANSLLISSGGMVSVDSQSLAVASSVGADVSNVRFTIENIANGYFRFKNTSGAISTFYMKNISDGVVEFVHLGGNALAPRYRVVVNSTGSITTIFSDLNATFLGYAPSLVNNKLAANQGMPTLLEANDLSANDQDDGLTGVSFIIRNPTHGQFYVDNVTANTFSQPDVLNRKVQFVHDGSRNPPSYEVAATDGKSTTPYQPAIITFNYAPQLNVTSVRFDQGQPTKLDPLYVSATDVETFPNRLIFYTTNVTQGRFSYTSNLNASITAFEQSLLATGGIQFVQNGSDATPTVVLRVFDGTLYSPWQALPINLNRRPVLQGGIADQVVTQDDDFSFDLPAGLFRDPDVNDRLTYQAWLAGNVPLPPGVQFTPPSHFSGNLPSVTSYRVKYEASDSRGLTASTEFILSSKQSSADYYRTIGNSLGGVVGSAFAVLGYLWLRRRISMHRRHFFFANKLRGVGVANLHYFDFMRFEGNAYKAKMDIFIQQLRQDYGSFYDELTEEEMKCFAICVAQILVTRQLISSAHWYDALFGILCCLNVGRPYQLDLEKFEKQRQGIAAEAVSAWESVANYKLAPMSDLKEGDKKEGDEKKEGKPENGTIYVGITADGGAIEYKVFDQDFREGEEEQEIIPAEGTITAEELSVDVLPMSKFSGTPTKKTTIYVEITDDTIKYQILDKVIKDGERKIFKGTITAKDLDVEALPQSIDDLKPHLSKLLKVTLEKGHTRPEDVSMSHFPRSLSMDVLSMSEFNKSKPPEKSAIYVEITDGEIKYKVFDKAVKKGEQKESEQKEGEQKVFEGSITAKDLNIKALPKSIDDLKPHLSKFLEVALQRGHIRLEDVSVSQSPQFLRELKPYIPRLSEMTLERGHTRSRSDKLNKAFPYNNYTFGEKAKVLCCRKEKAKPLATAPKTSWMRMFDSGRPRQHVRWDEVVGGTELANLKKREGEVALEVKSGGAPKKRSDNMDERMTSVEERLEILEQRPLLWRAR